MQRPPVFSYVGGKSKAVKTLLPICAAFVGNREVVAPFVGGGSVEMNLADLGHTVHAYDLFEPLVNLWQEILHNREALYQTISSLPKHPLTGSHFPLSTLRYREFYAGRNNPKRYSPTDRAMMLFACIYSTYVSRLNSKSPIRHSEGRGMAQLERLREFTIENFNVNLAPFEEALERHPDAFVFADPPYATAETSGAVDYYGQDGELYKGFDHQLLADMLHERKDWVLTYNDCDLVRDLYDGYRMIEAKGPLGWSHSAGTQGAHATQTKQGSTNSELIILGRSD